MKKTIIYATVIAILITAGCKKNIDAPNAKDPIISNFSPSSLEYVQLTPGKYLVYKDSASGNLDSVVVTKSGFGWVTTPAIPYQGIFNPGSPAYANNYMKLTLTKFSGTSQNVWFDGHARAELVTDDAIIKMYEIDSAGSALHNNIITGPPVSLITIETKTYTDVIKSVAVTAVDMNDPGYNKSTLYWAKKIGIIKRTIVTTGGKVNTYNLLRNN
ncbi:MAG: hypothetical protein ACSLE0_10815 [Chitinophagaceae bacterium]